MIYLIFTGEYRANFSRSLEGYPVKVSSFCIPFPLSCCCFYNLTLFLWIDRYVFVINSIWKIGSSSSSCIGQNQSANHRAACLPENNFGLWEFSAYANLSPQLLRKFVLGKWLGKVLIHNSLFRFIFLTSSKLQERMTFTDKQICN